MNQAKLIYIPLVIFFSLDCGFAKSKISKADIPVIVAKTAMILKDIGKNKRKIIQHLKSQEDRRKFGELATKQFFDSFRVLYINDSIVFKSKRNSTRIRFLSVNPITVQIDDANPTTLNSKSIYKSLYGTGKTSWIEFISKAYADERFKTIRKKDMNFLAVAAFETAMRQDINPGAFGANRRRRWVREGVRDLLNELKIKEIKCEPASSNWNNSLKKYDMQLTSENGDVYGVSCRERNNPRLERRVSSTCNRTLLSRRSTGGVESVNQSSLSDILESILQHPKFSEIEWRSQMELAGRISLKNVDVRCNNEFSPFNASDGSTTLGERFRKNMAPGREHINCHFHYRPREDVFDPSHMRPGSKLHKGDEVSHYIRFHKDIMDQVEELLAADVNLANEVEQKMKDHNKLSDLGKIVSSLSSSPWDTAPYRALQTCCNLPECRTEAEAVDITEVEEIRGKEQTP